MSTNQPYNNQNKNQPNVKPEVVSPQPNKMPETANSSKEKPASHTDTERILRQQSLLHL